MITLNKNTIILTVASVLIIFGFLYLVFSTSNKPTSNEPFQSAKTLSENDHIKWASESGNLLVEYSDFQCPNCKLWSDFFNQLGQTNDPNFEKIKENVTFVYRHFPLTNIHPNALESAHAAEAAAMQDKFYEMHDLLFLNQASWSELKDPTDYFVGLAEDLEIDIEKFKSDLTSSEVKSKVNQDLDSGRRANVNSTASFYLNGQYLSNLNSTQDLLDILLEEIEK
ncbi:MAG: thioredoxin domain-containing protein [Patescibacteria group bacterium]